jgi:hypothetical protein
MSDQVAQVGTFENQRGEYKSNLSVLFTTVTHKVGFQSYIDGKFSLNCIKVEL